MNLLQGWLTGRLATVLCLFLVFTPQWCTADWKGLTERLRTSQGSELPYRQTLRGFYTARDYRPVWFDGAAPTAAARQLVTGLDNAGDEGLSPANYGPAALRRECLTDVPADPAGCELRLSGALLRYASDVGYGLLQASEVDPHWHLPQAGLDGQALLRQVADRADIRTVLAGLPPPHPQYRRLRDALATLKLHGAEWFPLPEGPNLRPGDSGRQVLALRERLGSLEPAVLAAAEPALYDDELLLAVERFQAQYGLDVDGVVGPRTRAAMNVPVASRIDQLRLNLERWRWLPRQLGEQYVLVNLAGFELRLVAADRVVLRMRAISGRPDRTSPSFASQIRQLVLNPDWTVPRRLAVEDLLPRLRRDPLALQRQGIHVLQRQGGKLVEVDPRGVDWKPLHRNNFPYVLRQEPGPHNSLGRIKFMMPNPFDIFIHDTPQKSLFAKSVRTFSSGCIRVERPIELAAHLMGDNAADNEALLRERLGRDETEFLPVTPAVPVYLVYLTAWVDDAGNLQWRNDVYGRDLPMYDRFSMQ